MRVSAALFLFAAAAASAQDVPKYESSLNMTIDPGSVTDGERATWCSAQSNTCQLLCNDDTESNDCIQADLSYECLCASNSSAPALQDYTQTIPTFVCNTLFGQCNVQHANDQEAQDDCASNIQDLCATQNPPKDPIGDDTSSTMTTASATTSAPSETATDAEVTTSTSTDFAAATMAPAGNGVVAVAAVGLLAYLL